MNSLKNLKFILFFFYGPLILPYFRLNLVFSHVIFILFFCQETLDNLAKVLLFRNVNSPFPVWS